MGGLVALDLAIDGIENGIRGLALSDPNVAVAISAPAVKVMAGKLLSKILPRVSLANELDAGLICRNQPLVDAYLADPLVYSTITPRWFTEMVKSQKRVVAYATQYDTPLLMLLGEGDAICDWRASAALARNWGADAKVISYPELYHEIFNELEGDKVIEDMIAWMDTLA